MKLTHRVLMIAGAISLLGLFVFPMWSIWLEAPQYPKGSELGIFIHIDKVTDSRPNDLENLNTLNHYIGMKPIQPDAIPELEYMPIVVLILVGLGIVAGALGKRWMIITWLAILTIAGSVGMYDFWKWEYDYGHDLDPKAIIKIEGMSYQPPLIGSKQLLNFTAHSYPAIGFGFIVFGAILAMLAWWLSRTKSITPLAGAKT